MKECYDSIIVGAGIGGLVCGSYLAQAGLKVLILEKERYAGGYCSAFHRNGYTFDIGVHHLGSCRQNGGTLFRVLKELSLIDQLGLTRNDPCERVVAPGKTILIHLDHEYTKKEFINSFPKEEKSIIRFFDYVLNESFLFLRSKVGNTTFKKLLDSFFDDFKLKAILSMLLVNLGLPSERASALVAIVLFREYILDPGYYPKGGMDRLPELLVSRYLEMGGDIVFSRRVTSILTRNNKVVGVFDDKGTKISTASVVSDMDASTLFKEIVDCECPEKKIVDTLEPSISAFALYLGVTGNFNSKIQKHYVTHYIKTYDIADWEVPSADELISNDIKYVYCSFPSSVDQSLAPNGKSVFQLFTGAKFNNEDCWDDKKEIIADKLIDDFEKLVPGIRKNIDTKIIATPNTFKKFTANREGALFGWASTVGQFDRNVFPAITSIDNLYLTGHWATTGFGQSGVPTVALSGRNAATIVLRRNKK